MTTQTPRMRRLAGRIQEIVAITLRDQVKDPRVGMITVTDTRITPDLRDATVYYTVLGDDADYAATAAALESAKGVLRSAVGRGTGVRFTPTLTFVADAIPEVARHIDDLLVVAKQADEQVHQQAATAQFAGDADPYRKPDADDGSDTVTDERN
ncbi:MAG: 30S ribosome-binding factor RbfA [Mycobacteriales bacterium]